MSISELFQGFDYDRIAIRQILLETDSTELVKEQFFTKCSLSSFPNNKLRIFLECSSQDTNYTLLEVRQILLFHFQQTYCGAKVPTNGDFQPWGSTDCKRSVQYFF